MKVAVASHNPAKIKAVSTVLEELGITCEIVPTDVASGVADQPFSEQETMQGAKNRAQNALAAAPETELAIGLEGGVHELAGKTYLCNWGALADPKGNVYTAGGAQLELPEEIAAELREGKELGPVMDAYAGELGIRHDKGAIGILTGGLVNRSEMFAHIVKLLMGQSIRNSD